MCVLDLVPCQIWREVERKARRPHRCDGCLGRIAPGEVYLAHFSVLDGEATHEKCCAACKADREAFAAEHGGTMPTPGWLWHMLTDCISDEPESASKWEPMLQRMKQRKGG